MSALFNVEFLQNLTYERSKLWALSMDSFTAKETFTDMDINELCEDFALDNNENDSSNELASMEDDEPSSTENDGMDNLTLSVLKNITNVTRFPALLNNKSVLPENILNEEQTELIDMFSQTLPIINEHHRQLQEFGLDKVLETFDKDKIEEKVGGWLNYRNSLCGGNNTMLECSKSNGKNCAEGRKNTKHAFDKSLSKSFSDKEMFNDSDDSLQSGETARYIRSSRTSIVKKSATTTTMIKTYRMIKSARETVRKKYDCEMDDGIVTNHNFQNRQNYCNMSQFQKARKYDRTPSSSQTQRRKVFRKRVFNLNCSTTDSSSDSEYCYDDCHSSRCKNLNLPAHHRSVVQYNTIKKSKCQRSAMKMPSAQINRLYYFPNSPLKSFSSATRKPLATKRKQKYPNDIIPSKDELECHCCDNGKLCNDFKHTANSSTEKWYVENYSPPKKSIVTNTICTTEKIESTQKGVKTKNPKEKSKANDKTETMNRKRLAKAKPAASKNKTNPKNKSVQEFEKSSDLELQMAIEASKELYEKEKQLKLAIEKKQEKPEEEESGNVEDETAKPNLISNNTREETFFSIPLTKKICNSTALDTKSQAYKRQISHASVDKEDKVGKQQDKPEIDLKNSIIKKNKTENCKTKTLTNKKIKSSTTGKGEKKQMRKATTSSNIKSYAAIRPLENNSKLAPAQSEIMKPEKEIIISSDSDCTLVTSTTNVEKTSKGILVYAPENKDTLPEDCNTSKGYFTITEKYLSTIIGKKQAERLLKSYVGRKHFRLDSTVYYQPPDSPIEEYSSSDSDALDYARQHGGFYEESK